MNRVQYFDVDGVPGEWDRTKMPRIFTGGQWKTYYNVERFFSNAVPVSKERFDALMAEQQPSGEG
jgi:hypothetical protein